MHDPAAPTAGNPAPVRVGLVGVGLIDHEECWPVLRTAFATAVRTGVTTAPDAARGLRIQELLDQATRSLSA
ncbi:predicted protein [Streptomyces sp. SPB78]|uniref:hypothetical protein n=1 Tax=Streptomyces sp. (strain SPB78) TaxID=591157 RepID=UPI0001B53ED5|nr:predicted protein [Streptomyces sp. SPB78]